MTLDEIAEYNPDALLADGFEGAIIGLTINPHHPMVVVYDYRKCVEILMAQGLSDEEAVEYLEFNTLGAYVGKNGPLYMERIERNTGGCPSGLDPEADRKSVAAPGSAHSCCPPSESAPITVPKATK